MPISVVCSSCKARFSVSEKFAGKKGPCPKCKTVLTVPEVVEEVTVHVPEQFASGGKDSKGRAVSKPIERQETKFNPISIAIGACATLVVFVIALLLRGLTDKTPVIVAGLLLISPPLAVAGYTFLRDEELMEPYRGKALWIRAVICGLAYAALWAAYAPLPAYEIITGEAWQWLFVAPVFVSVGAGVSYACFDLDFGSGAMHYCFYLLVCLVLRFALGLPPLWALGSGSF